MSTESHVRVQTESCPEGEDVPSVGAHIHFDPGHTQVYADGWMVN